MQTKVFVYSKNRIFPKNQIFLKILCPKIYGTLRIKSGKQLGLNLFETLGFCALAAALKDPVHENFSAY